MKKISAMLAVLLLFSVSSYAKGDYGTPGEFLSWGTGARAQGMGRAFTGLADDISAIMYNPAGLAFQNPLQITTHHVFLFYDTIYDFAAVSYPVSGIGTFGLGYVRLSSFGYDARDAMWTDMGDFDVSQSGIILSYSREILSWISAGLNLKLVMEDNFESSAAGYGADFGIMLQPADYFSFGASILNIVPAEIKLDQQGESYPMIIKSGIAFKLFGDRVIPVFDVEKELSQKDVKFRLGLEVYPVQFMALRAGLDETEITAGIGVGFKPYYVDYSLSVQDMGITHRMSFTFAFGGFDVNLSAEPKIFSPVGVKKTSTITIYAVTKYPVSEWELNIINEDGDSVRTYSGDENPPASVVWDGKDDRGLPVSDGEYNAVMKVIDVNGRELNSNSEGMKISNVIPMQPGSIRLEE